MISKPPKIQLSRRAMVIFKALEMGKKIGDSEAETVEKNLLVLSSKVKENLYVENSDTRRAWAQESLALLARVNTLLTRREHSAWQVR